MAKLPTLKDPHREAKVFQARVRVMSVVIVLAALLMLARLSYLQIVQHQYFTTLAQDNRLKLVAIPPTRGLIYSRDGVLLAENRPSFVLEMVSENVQNIDTSLSGINEIVSL